jgi:antitoxin FitA
LGFGLEILAQGRDDRVLVQTPRCIDIMISFNPVVFSEVCMAQFVVRNLEDEVKAALQRRARAHGWSMEEEVRRILRRAILEPEATPGGLGSRMAARFADVGLDQPLPELRGQDIEPMALGE